MKQFMKYEFVSRSQVVDQDDDVVMCDLEIARGETVNCDGWLPRDRSLLL
jgi:hypothetical protein